jgi:hypothetical protein
MANQKTRVDALAQLKEAQIMLATGNKELALAQKKIARAQELINQSADELRLTWPNRLKSKK